MTKFELFDIRSIKDCIRAACNQRIDNALIERGYRTSGDDYKIRCDNIQEAERLVALMDSLKEENE